MRIRARALRPSLLVLVAVAAIVPAACGRLDKDAVGTDLGTLQSAGNEGMLVADQAARARAPDSFIEIRSAELTGEAEDASTALAETPAEAGLTEAASEGAHIGARIAAHLDALHKNPDDRALAARVRDHLRDLAKRAGRLEDSL
jgi:hypothetical protein